MDYSPQVSSVHGISQARILEWGTISSSRGSSQPRDQTHASPASVGGLFTTEPPEKPICVYIYVYIYTHTHTCTCMQIYVICAYLYLGLPCCLRGKESTCSARDAGSIPGSGRSPRERKDNPLQYSWLEIQWREEPGRLQSMGYQELVTTGTKLPPPPILDTENIKYRSLRFILFLLKLFGIVYSG